MTQKPKTKTKPRAPRYAKDRTAPPSLLTLTRKSRGLSLEQVAVAVGTHHTNLLRIEHGEQRPKADVAQRIFEFFNGVVPLAKIYFPYDTPELCPTCAAEWAST